MPRLARLRKVLDGVKPPQPVVVPPRVLKEPPKKQERKPLDPAKYSTHQQSLYHQYTDAVANGRPHFRVGGKEIWLPWAFVTLLPPSAKMTPFQAQFQVPKSFNKLDLRDYLWHIYGLRALSVSTQIKWSEWVRTRMSRYRTPQVKKMIIEMEQPFVWPSRDLNAEESHRKSSSQAFDRYQDEMGDRRGSDLKKPAKAFDGVLGPYPDSPTSWVPVAVHSKMANDRRRAENDDNRRKEMELLRSYLKL